METPGPLSICLTNMVIVFGVLIFLACVIQLIHIVDPTKGKKKGSGFKVQVTAHPEPRTLNLDPVVKGLASRLTQNKLPTQLSI